MAQTNFTSFLLRSTWRQLPAVLLLTGAVSMPSAQTFANNELATAKKPFILTKASDKTAPAKEAKNPPVQKNATFEEVVNNDQFKVPALSDELAHKHEAKAVLISCSDFRLRDATNRLMDNKLHLGGSYDELTLPGAALAYVQQDYPSWPTALTDSIGILEGLHHFKDIVFLDHRDCGAYRLLKKTDTNTTTEQETAIHKAVFKEAREKMNKQFPNLTVHTLLIGLDGVVEDIKDTPDSNENKTLP